MCMADSLSVHAERRHSTSAYRWQGGEAAFAPARATLCSVHALCADHLVHEWYFAESNNEPEETHHGLGIAILRSGRVEGGTKAGRQVLPGHESRWPGEMLHAWASQTLFQSHRCGLAGLRAAGSWACRRM